MLYLLLYPLHSIIPASTCSRYETLRSVLAGLTALALSLALGPLLIERFRDRAYRPNDSRSRSAGASEEGRHADDGRPADLASTLVATLLLASLTNPYVWLAVFVMVSFGAIGFVDDYLKLERGHGAGLAVRTKCMWSFVCAFIAAFWLVYVLGFDTSLTIPFVKSVHPDIALVGYILFAMIVIVGSSHAVDLDRRSRRARDRTGDDGRVYLLGIHLRRRQPENFRATCRFRTWSAPASFPSSARR